LFQNYPNPFNPSTVINYQLAVNSFVTLKVYDMLGNEVATLVNEEKSAGTYEVEFHSAVDNQQLASGIYFYQLRTDDFVATKKLVMMK
ncbi:MAG: T9SS type A sorting domain-containing protein, partial [Ignavibacteria bacterium]|nr:T9SS type A sorting domain-containing protein [Ignavibacteria bacterium]